MQKSGWVKSAFLLLGLGASLLAASASFVSLRRLHELGPDIANFDARLAALDEAMADAKASNLAALSLEARSSGERLARSLSGLERRLSALIGKLDSGGEGEAVAKAEPGPIDDRELARSLLEADRCLAEGRFADAAALYGRVLAVAPGDGSLRRKRAISLYRANPADSSRYGLIEGDLRVASAEGESEDALEVLALVSIERRDWAKAKEYFGRLLELRPNDDRIRREAEECAIFADEARETEPPVAAQTGEGE